MSRTRVVIVGAGFAGYHAARTLAKTVTPEQTEIVLVNPTDYFLYLPLLPEVASGVLEPRAVSVSLPATLPNVRLVLGEVTTIDPDRRVLSYTDPEDRNGSLTFDRLVLSAGSVHKLLPIPGLAEHGHGFRGIPEALYLRDHMTRQIELAAATSDQEERDQRCTFVVVGAGYTGTEVASQGSVYTSVLARRHSELHQQPIRWMLLDIAPRVLPEQNIRLSRTADRVLRDRGVEVRTETSIDEATKLGVTLSTGESVPTRSLIWCVGVRPDPVVEELGLPTAHGRLVVDDHLRVPGYPHLFACGDVAAVPNTARPGTLAPMTAQHAAREGKLAAGNVAASLGHGRSTRYRHRDLGFVVDLGGAKAAANPLRVPLSGPLAKVVTRTYHLMAMPANRLRVAIGWALDAIMPRQTVQLGLVRSGTVPLDTMSPEVPHLHPAMSARHRSAGR